MRTSFPLILLAAFALALAGCGKKQPAPQAKPATNETAAATETAAAKPLDGQADPFLTQQLRVFIQKQGRLPVDFAELVRTSLDSRPRTPAGMRWAIDPVTQEVKLVKQ
ncbi:MAG TPA: hypothetical protein VNT26_16605 [Candidatus Sulfotelmatobacter sp.]|nr:hypothetical protein [Candidatus Sulfotelmatobacter sp.]